MPFGLTADELIVLGHIRERSQCTLQDAESFAPASGGTLTELVERMERNGFVNTYTESVNGRRLLLATTRRGDEAFESGLQKYFVHVLGTLSSLDSTQRIAIEELLGEVRDFGESR